MNIEIQETKDMAHFARIDETNTVREVIAVRNEVLEDENGVEQEEIGIAFCRSLYGEDTSWVQTSYSGSIRGVFAGVGDVYDPELDEFIAQANGTVSPE